MNKIMKSDNNIIKNKSRRAKTEVRNEQKPIQENMIMSS